LALYGFETKEPHRAIPQDVVDFLPDIEDMVHALPEKTSTSFRLPVSSPYLHITFRGFSVRETKTPWPRLPNPLLMFLSPATAGMDTEVLKSHHCISFTNAGGDETF